MADRDRWILHLKNLRATHGVSVFDAERLAFVDPAWWRWAERQIVTDERCRRMALQHIRYNAEASLIGRDGDRLFVR